jgi:hypothetical protein
MSMFQSWAQLPVSQHWLISRISLHCVTNAELPAALQDIEPAGAHQPPTGLERLEGFERLKGERSDILEATQG